MISVRGGAVEADLQDDSEMCADATDIIRYVRCRLKATYGPELMEEIFKGIINDSDKPKYQVIRETRDMTIAFGKGANKCLTQ